MLLRIVSGSIRAQPDSAASAQPWSLRISSELTDQIRDLRSVAAASGNSPQKELCERLIACLRGAEDKTLLTRPQRSEQLASALIA